MLLQISKYNPMSLRVGASKLKKKQPSTWKHDSRENKNTWKWIAMGESHVL